MEAAGLLWGAELPWEGAAPSGLRTAVTTERSAFAHADVSVVQEWLVTRSIDSARRLFGKEGKN